MAGRRCSVCDHNAVVTINRLIAEAKQSYRNIAKQFDLNPNAVWNHGTKHLAVTLARAIERKHSRDTKPSIAVAEHAEASQAAVVDEFMDDIQYSKRMAKLGVERCMTGIIDPETEETKPSPIEEFRLAPGFLAAVDRANTLLGQATGRLTQAPASATTNILTIVLPRPEQPTELPPAIDVQALPPSTTEE